MELSDGEVGRETRSPALTHMWEKLDPEDVWSGAGVQQAVEPQHLQMGVSGGGYPLGSIHLSSDSRKRYP